MEHEFVCAHCGATGDMESRIMVGSVPLCSRCAEEETVICSRCGERIFRDDNAGNEEIPLCQDCFDRHFERCCHCGRIIHQSDAYYEDEDSDEPFCYSCYSQYAHANGIHDYYYKPEPIFRGEGDRYFGLELEIDGAGERDDYANKVLSTGNPDGVENIYCKHDGSLDDGFEIVTHPMTLDYHMNEMPWAEVLQKARKLGYLSHQACTCGLHIHVNRNCFGATEEEQDECIARVLYFFEKHWEELLKFSRRTHRQLERWAARYGYKEHPREVLENAKKGNLGRYTSVNLTNEDTIEFRIFRGTLKLNTLIATLQLVNRICDVALFMSDEELKDMSWTTFVAGCTQPELVQYLKERRLYVNEPVVAEAEV